MIAAKTFYELNNQELYQILRLRSEVFVVEQECVYQDLDNKDQISVHVFQKEKDEIEDIELKKFTNELIKKITQNLETFTYNVIIASMHEGYNFLMKHMEKKTNKKVLLESYIKILTIFSPIIPHLVSECLEELNVNKLDSPEYEQNNFVDLEVDYVVQINGKKRSLINAKKDISQDFILNLVKKDKLVDKYLTNKTIKKVIFVKNRLINILVNE